MSVRVRQAGIAVATAVLAVGIVVATELAGWQVGLALAVGGSVVLRWIEVRGRTSKIAKDLVGVFPGPERPLFADRLARLLDAGGQREMARSLRIEYNLLDPD
jgi:hypothetical protein